MGVAFKIASWNVQGLSDVKIQQLIRTMQARGIGLLCMQEVRRPGSAYFLEDGFLIIQSGSSGEEREWAGVGFIVAPWLRPCISGFLQKSNRLCSIKLKTTSGKLSVICAYAPHNGRPHDERQQFFSELSTLYDHTNGCQEKIVFGDLNSRIGRQLPGEEEQIGLHSFGRAATSGIPGEFNRDLLLELCVSHELAVANTFFDLNVDKQVTYREPGVSPMDNVTDDKFAQLDLMLVPQGFLHQVCSLDSVRTVALASQHFLVESYLRCSFSTPREKRQVSRANRSALKDAEVRSRFVNNFDEGFQPNQAGLSLDEKQCRIKEAFETAGSMLPKEPKRPNRPWISQNTLTLIEARDKARAAYDYAKEQRLHKQIRSAAKRDRAQWLNGIASTGSWEDVRRLRKKKRPLQGRLRNVEGELVSSDNRADTMAAYLQKVQWAVRPCTAVPDRPALGPTLPICVAPISAPEVECAVRKLKDGKSFGEDGVPAEYWKAIFAEGGEGRRWLLDFCADCWERCEVPTDWHLARVSAIFKKGEPAECCNYRPISILNIGYKIFASVLLERLRRGGAEQRLWGSQFGFRRGAGTEDAIHVARRRIEEAIACRGGELAFLALDWKAAFDSVSPDGLSRALLRFGVPQRFVEMIAAIYSDRRFIVSDCGACSEPKPQDSGISQGCPLSPFLFVVLMSVVMHDAKAQVNPIGNYLGDLLYADDTLLIGSNAVDVERYLAEIAKAGAEYGLQLHMGKCQLLSVGNLFSIRAPYGTVIESKESMIYLGALLSADGRARGELNRRLGAAQSDFQALSRVWRHSALSRQRKIELLKAMVESKLMYGLSSLWLSKPERRKLDGFQNRCLRRILSVKPSFLSRVPNAAMLHQAAQPKLSSRLLRQQLVLFGKVASQPAHSQLRSCCLFGDSLQPLPEHYVRRVGRPRLTWTREALNAAVAVAGGSSALEQILRSYSAAQWLAKVEAYLA